MVPPMLTFDVDNAETRRWRYYSSWRPTDAAVTSRVPTVAEPPAHTEMVARVSAVDVSRG